MFDDEGYVYHRGRMVLRGGEYLDVIRAANEKLISTGKLPVLPTGTWIKLRNIVFNSSTEDQMTGLYHTIAPKYGEKIGNCCVNLPMYTMVDLLSYGFEKVALDSVPSVIKSGIKEIQYQVYVRY